MRVKLKPELKTWMVGEATKLADEVVRAQAARKAEERNRGREEDDSDENRGGEASQLRNLVRITQTESEVAVLRNYIEYQAARKATEDFWQPIYRGVIDTLSEISQRCPPSKTEHRRVAMQTFFEYMVRRYVYAVKLQSAQAVESSEQEGAA